MTCFNVDVCGTGGTRDLETVSRELGEGLHVAGAFHRGERRDLEGRVRRPAQISEEGA